MNPVSVKRSVATAVAAAALVLPVALAAQAAPMKKAAPPKAKISARQAEAAAVRRIPGKAISAKYEFEEGHWQYAVWVNDKKGQRYEVEVDATTGKVTDSEKTSAAEEASEAAADKKAAMKKSGASQHSPAKGEAGEKGEKGEAGESGG